MPRSALPLAAGLGLVAGFVVLAAPGVARADEIDDLEKSLGAEHAALATSDCTRACQALSSIRRAADRICAIEPGPRCVAAQAKALEAARRVRDACPQCSAAALTPGIPQEPGGARPSSSAPPAPPAPPVAAPSKAAPAPGSTDREARVTTAEPNAPSKGGCASCDAGGVSPGDGAAGLLAALGLARLLRARGRRRR